MKMFQKQVAAQIGVETCSIFNWESNKTQPDVRFMPAIICFLGYNPLPPPATTAEKLVRHRTSLGLTQKESAARIGVDQCTLARWERGEREPGGTFDLRVDKYLAQH